MRGSGESEVAPGIAAETIVPATGDKRRILIVEDNRGDVFLILEAIRAHNVPVDVCVVEDGAEAVAVFERAETDSAAFCPEIVLLDLNLPKRNGLEVLQRIRQSDRCKATPVVILTSSDSSKDREETARLGADRYFRKPNTYEQFLKVGTVLNEVLAGAVPRARATESGR